MLRFVIKPEDAEIIYDEKGKASARGAYICPKNECLARAKKTRAFERVFSKKTEDSFFEEALRIIENKDE